MKPFNTSEYHGEFSETVIKQIESIPYYFLAQEPYVLTSNWAPEFHQEENTDYSFLSPISVEYLGKMKKLVEEYEVPLYIISPPVKLSLKDRIESFDRAEFEGSDLESKLDCYLNNISYESDNKFIDNSHLHKPKDYQKMMLDKIERVSINCK